MGYLKSARKVATAAGKGSWDLFMELGKAKHQGYVLLADQIVEQPVKTAAAGAAAALGHPTPLAKLAWDRAGIAYDRDHPEPGSAAAPPPADCAAHSPRQRNEGRRGERDEG